MFANPGGLRRSESHHAERMRADHVQLAVAPPHPSVVDARRWLAGRGITSPRALFDEPNGLEQLIDVTMAVRNEHHITGSDGWTSKHAPGLTAAYPERTSARVHVVA